MKYDINCMQHAITIILTADYPFSFIISFMQAKYINSDPLSSISELPQDTLNEKSNVIQTANPLKE